MSLSIILLVSLNVHFLTTIFDFNPKGESFIIYVVSRARWVLVNLSLLKFSRLAGAKIKVPDQESLQQSLLKYLKSLMCLNELVHCKTP